MSLRKEYKHNELDNEVIVQGFGEQNKLLSDILALKLEYLNPEENEFDIVAPFLRSLKRNYLIVMDSVDEYKVMESNISNVLYSSKDLPVLEVAEEIEKLTKRADLVVTFILSE